MPDQPSLYLVPIHNPRSPGQNTHLKGPVTNNRPLSSCFKKTTLFPRKRPAKRMRTVPGVIDLRRTVLDGVLRDFFGTETSSAWYTHTQQTQRVSEMYSSYGGGEVGNGRTG